MQTHNHQCLKKYPQGNILSNKGLSLIELMVAVVIGLILIAGVANIFVNSRQAYRIQEDLSVMQENSRTLLSIFSYDLRMADHWGGIAADSVDGGASGSDAKDCSASWIKSINMGLVGYEGASSSPLAATCFAAGDYVANTDIIVVRYADADGAVTNAELDDTANASKYFIKSELGRRASLKTGGNLYSSDTDVAGQVNYPYKVAVYFIRPCSVKSGTVCTSSDDNGSPIPTLTRLSLSGTSLVQEPLIEGVEQLQLQYGIMNNTASVTEFKSSSDMTSSKWDNVAAVRVGIIVRSERVDTAHTDTKKYFFPFSGDQTATIGVNDFTPSSGVQNLHRKQVFKTINIRNRVRS